MKNFLALINYSLEGNKRWTKDRLYVLKYWLLWIFFFASWMVLFSGTYEEFPFTEFLMYAFGIMTAIVGVAYCVKPSMLRLVPVSYKRRVLYYYASILIYTIITLVVLFVLAMIVIVPTFLVMYYTQGENFFSEIVQDMSSFGAQEYLFSLFKMIFTISLVSIASRMETKRGILISFVVLYVMHFAGGIVLSNLITSGEASTIIDTKNIYPYFDTLPNPTLAVILCGVFALVAFAISFTVIVYKEKPKKY